MTLANAIAVALLYAAIIWVSLLILGLFARGIWLTIKRAWK